MADFVFNDADLRDVRRRLRRDGTPAEALLWMRLQKKQLGGRRFRRQYSVGRYVVDFYCPSERLAVELDGAVHGVPGVGERDAVREAYLRQRGIRVVRIPNEAVYWDVEGVAAFVAAHFGGREPEDG